MSGTDGPEDDPFTFVVDGRTYTATFGGRFFDDVGNELPHEVGVALFDRAAEEEERR